MMEEDDLLSRSCESMSIGMPCDRMYLVSTSLLAFPVTKAEMKISCSSCLAVSLVLTETHDGLIQTSWFATSFEPA